MTLAAPVSAMVIVSAASGVPPCQYTVPRFHCAPSATSVPSTSDDGAASVPMPQPALLPKPAPAVVTVAPVATLAAPANGAMAASAVASRVVSLWFMGILLRVVRRTIARGGMLTTDLVRPHPLHVGGRRRAAVEQAGRLPSPRCDTSRHPHSRTVLRVTFAYSLHQAPFSPRPAPRDDAPGPHGLRRADARSRMAPLGDAQATAVLARDEGRLVGFKLGYAMTESRYYSWLGGVHLGARGSGVARQLMRRQHRWLREMGCTQVETSTDQGNAAMARINLQEGFTVCGTRSMPGRVQVLYLKLLT